MHTDVNQLDTDLPPNPECLIPAIEVEENQIGQSRL
jgi:hypothetical protein